AGDARAVVVLVPQAGLTRPATRLFVNYVSTRGAWRESPQPFCAILLEGLAPDGGLAVPQSYPAFAAGELDALAGAPYRTVAYAVLSKFVGDIPATDLRAIVDRTYTATAF